ncbi:YhgE/Pip domain-containing protein [Tessaracoccus sp. Z1128]
MTPETLSGRRLTWPAVVALALVPLLAVASLIGLGRPGADEQIDAAVVNLDEAVTVNGQIVPMGRQLAAAMIERDGDNVTWTLADAPSASAGLRSGRFSAVVTIPSSFSASATSFSANEAATAVQATLQVQVSDNAPVTDAQVAQEIARLATDTVNSTLTEGYLDGIYVGFNTVGEQFTTIVEGAEQLNDGSAQLADGVLQSSQGANQLDDGMALLSENGPRLADGGDQLVIGIGELRSGSSQLSEGAGQLADGMEQYADGVDRFAAQTPGLVDGVGRLADGADQLLGGLPAFADGAAQAVGGVGQLRDGLDQVIVGLDQPQDFSDLELLAGGARQTAVGAAGVSGGLGQVHEAMQGFSTGAIPAPDQVAALGGQVAAAFECPVADSTTCDMLRDTFAAGASAGVTAGFRAGTGTASAALTTPDPATGMSLLTGAEGVAGGADQLADGVDRLVTELPAETQAQLAELKSGLTQIRDGADQLATQAKPIVDNAPAISSGATRLNDGIQQLDEQLGALPAGVDQLSSGARRLASGTAELASGTAQLDGGVGQLETGAATFVDGVTQYTEGVSSAADGTSMLATGLAQLSDGAGLLDDGVATFATELAKGADQVPTYSADERATLASVVAAPVDKPDDVMQSGRVPLVSLLLVAALWLGAMASFVVARPVPRDVVTSRASSLALWARTVWLPLAVVAAQALVLGVVGGVVLEAGFAKTVALAALLVVLGASFVVANHALSAWWGNAGRAVALLLLVATVALGLSSAASWLSPVAAVSPLQNGLLLVRTWLAGGSGEIGLAAMAVLMAAVGLALSVLAISSRRRLTVDQFRRAA